MNLPAWHFDEADVAARARANDPGLGLRASFHQHRGKCFFDQPDYAAAIEDFQKALTLREKIGAGANLIASSALALATAQKRLS